MKGYSLIANLSVFVGLGTSDFFHLLSADEEAVEFGSIVNQFCKFNYFSTA